MRKRVETDVEMFMHNCGCVGCKRMLVRAVEQRRRTRMIDVVLGMMAVNAVGIAAYLLWRILHC